MKTRWIFCKGRKRRTRVKDKKEKDAQNTFYWNKHLKSNPFKCNVISKSQKRFLLTEASISSLYFPRHFHALPAVLDAQSLGKVAKIVSSCIKNLTHRSILKLMLLLNIGSFGFFVFQIQTHRCEISKHQKFRNMSRPEILLECRQGVKKQGSSHFHQLMLPLFLDNNPVTRYFAKSLPPGCLFLPLTGR